MMRVVRTNRGVAYSHPTRALAHSRKLNRTFVSRRKPVEQFVAASGAGEIYFRRAPKAVESTGHSRSSYYRVYRQEDLLRNPGVWIEFFPEAVLVQATSGLFCGTPSGNPGRRA